MHDLVSRTLDYVNTTTPCSESTDKERNKTRQSRGNELSGKGNNHSTVSQIHEAPCAQGVQDSNMENQNHDSEPRWEALISPRQDQNTETSTFHSRAISSPDSDYKCLCRSTITSCEACTFKDGQIFALVRILHSFHSGHLQTSEAQAVPMSRKGCQMIGLHPHPIQAGIELLFESV